MTVQSNRARSRASGRSGVSMIELVTTAVVMVTIMSFVTTLCFRTSNVWKDIGQRRVAVAELSNQLERLTRMEPLQIQKELQSLEPSEYSKRTLREVQLSGEVETSKLGPHITLKINWKRRYAGQPVVLVGWISPATIGGPKSQDSSFNDSGTPENRRE